MARPRKSSEELKHDRAKPGRVAKRVAEEAAELSAKADPDAPPPVWAWESSLRKSSGRGRHSSNGWFLARQSVRSTERNSIGEKSMRLRSSAPTRSRSRRPKSCRVNSSSWLVRASWKTWPTAPIDKCTGSPVPKMRIPYRHLLLGPKQLCAVGAAARTLDSRSDPCENDPYLPSRHQRRFSIADGNQPPSRSGDW